MFNTITAYSYTNVEEVRRAGRMRRTNACNFCRDKKIRCNGESPCANCRDHGEKCVMLKRRRGRLKDADPRSISLSARLKKIEELLGLGRLETNVASKRQNNLALDDPEERPVLQPSAETVSLGELEDSSIYSIEACHLDYQGPRTMLSLFSPPAIAWVCNTLKSNAFTRPALICIKEMTRRLKVNQNFTSHALDGLGSTTIWEYVNAYFNLAYNVEFGVVERQSFEQRLQLELENQHEESDAAWYALKNAVLAVGCRIVISKTGAFREACERSWKLFENGLSVHTQLLYQHTSVTGVQALIVLAYYTEAVGSPPVMYMLISSAVRLAFAKALHKQPPAAWHMSADEIRHRNWMFWAIYCFEKQIFVRSGRPSLLDDDEIDVEVPDRACSSITGSLKYCTIAIKIARLSSRVWKSLSSSRAMRQDIDSTIESLITLDQELVLLEPDCYPDLESLSTSMFCGTTPKVTLQQMLALRFLFNGLTFEIHTRLSYPWCSGVLSAQDKPEFSLQILRSRMKVLDTCRNTILLLRHIDLDASTPLMLGVTLPIHTLANLFVGILQNPESPETISNLALLDVLAGYFARVDYATDWGFCAQFARECALLARQHVESVSTSDPVAAIQTPDSAVNWPSKPLDDSMFEPPSIDDLDEWRSFLELGDDFQFDIWPTV